MSKMKFCANLSFMFNEFSFLDRYKQAQTCGFKYVESGFPFGFNIEEIVTAKKNSKVEQVLLNIYTGDVSKGELGHCAVLNKEKEFRSALEKSIDYAKALECHNIHIMSGKVENVTEENYITYENNLKYAVQRLEEENIIGLIEPINKYSVPNYFMNSYETALKIIKKINSPNLRLMLDIFHLQQINGNIFRNIEEFLPYTHHVQIAQVPNRNEPDTFGEINYKNILQHLEKVGYSGYIGLEYKPLNDSSNGLKWLSEYGYAL